MPISASIARKSQLQDCILAMTSIPSKLFLPACFQWLALFPLSEVQTLRGRKINRAWKKLEKWNIIQDIES
jgi:hypothetical protein